jgi:Outer membrane lipoprotein-sorting protein
MNRGFLTLALFLFLAFAATAQTTNGLSDAEIKGQQLAAELLQESPVTNLTEKGTLKIRNSKGVTTEIPVTFDTGPDVGSWIAGYRATLTNDHTILWLVITHRNNLSNLYIVRNHDYMQQHVSIIPTFQLNESQIMAPFAGSDFWIADLGLEFFHWPEQKVLKHENRRTRACTVLESTNPDPSASSYSHVDSWIDNETLGIVHAEAYDSNGKLLKVFDPKSFKKVNGQWELQDMEIRNVQTGSRTWIKFDLNDKS